MTGLAFPAKMEARKALLLRSFSSGRPDFGGLRHLWNYQKRITLNYEP